ncbi:hypothetical protein [Nonomuraea salmonea]|uniref:hypothetical protein n=1 Tax=Nonomuraea salmonea TaxID=46181 RepID=UPI002FEB7755
MPWPAWRRSVTRACTYSSGSVAGGDVGVGGPDGDGAGGLAVVLGDVHAAAALPGGDLLGAALVAGEGAAAPLAGAALGGQPGHGAVEHGERDGHVAGPGGTDADHFFLTVLRALPFFHWENGICQ